MHVLLIEGWIQFNGTQHFLVFQEMCGILCQQTINLLHTVFLSQLYCQVPLHMYRHRHVIHVQACPSTGHT